MFAERPEFLGDEDSQNKDEYEDFVRDTLMHQDQTNLLFKNILKRDKGLRSFKGSFSRDSLSGRNSYNSKGRFSSKYGDNRLYLQRLSRHSIDSSQGLETQEYQLKIRPKPRLYSHEELDESYFAKRSAEDGSNSQEELETHSEFGSGIQREFKIFDKKTCFESNYLSPWPSKIGWFLAESLLCTLSSPAILFLLLLSFLRTLPQVSEEP